MPADVLSSGGQPPAPPAAAAQEREWRRAWRGLLRWETALFGLLIASIVYGARASEHFLSTTNLFFIGLNIGEIAIMALPLTFIIITGEIDLSVASMLGLSSTLLGVLFRDGWSIWAAIAAVLAVGLAGGLLNGALVTWLGLPSIAVTIGTLTLFRGIAEILLKSGSVTGFPISWTNIGILPVPHTQISYSILIFLVMAIAFGVVLHATPLGRSIFAIGLQEEAAFFSGIRVRRIKLMLFALSGLVCAFAGILWTFRFATSRFDAGTGLELNVVAVVLLGGVSIFGGRGSIVGVVLAVAVMGCLQEAMTLVNIDAQVQNIVIGTLLLLSVIVPNTPALASRVRRRFARRGGDGPPASRAWRAFPVPGADAPAGDRAHANPGPDATDPNPVDPRPEGGSAIERAG